jgi:hypothetical protein
MYQTNFFRALFPVHSVLNWFGETRSSVLLQTHYGSPKAFSPSSGEYSRCFLQRYSKDSPLRASPLEPDRISQENVDNHQKQASQNFSVSYKTGFNLWKFIKITI